MASKPAWQNADSRGNRVAASFHGIGHGSWIALDLPVVAVPVCVLMMKPSRPLEQAKDRPLVRIAPEPLPLPGTAEAAHTEFYPAAERLCPYHKCQIILSTPAMYTSSPATKTEYASVSWAVTKC